ncbi:MAG TPA: ABC transporter ATP-binding protein [Syntrophorhabdaceae bacterium]|nr:ABC transporter ATP-binding protein [Syntrophorhabdaceae bacterium]
MTDALEKDKTILKVTNITKTFDGVRALDGVGFGVTRGHIKALIGPNGAGKTTLLNIINGLLVPDKGSVSFEGRELVGLTTDRIAMLGLSRTFQLIRLFTVNEATVLDNVMLGAHKHIRPTISEAILFRSRARKVEKAMREKAMDLLQFVGMAHAAKMTPLSLSFGNQRMVELARSLMADPLLLLLDEPASGLNDTEVEHFMELLSAIRKRGVTILLVEHNMKLVMNVSDDIVVIDFGKYLAQGDPQAICSNQQVIEAYLGTECGIGGHP